MRNDLHKVNCSMVCTACTCDLPPETRRAIARLENGETLADILAAAPVEAGLVVVEEEFGVRLGNSAAVVITGTGPWGRIHAEQEAKRVNHNATLPSVGQPSSGEVVTRTVTRYEHETEWTALLRPAPAADGGAESDQNGDTP